MGRALPETRAEETRSPSAIALESSLATASAPATWLLATLVVAAAAIPYLNTLAGGFVFDDHRVVLRDPNALASLAWLFPRTIAGSLYRPVTALTYAIDAAVAGSPAVFHATNVVLHVLVSLAAFVLARRLLARPWQAAAAAVLFAVHPIHTEAVANLSGRAELIAGLFVLTALWAVLRATDDDGDARWLALAFGATLLAVGGKESALTTPLLAVVLLAWQRPRIDRRSLAALAAVAAPCVLYVVARIAIVGSVGFHEAIRFADNPLAHGGAFSRIATALVVLLEYVGGLALPLRLSADDTFDQIPVVATLIDLRLAAAVAAFALMGLAAWWNRDRVPAVWWGALFAVAALAVTANVFFPIGTIKAERFLYLPSFGVCLAVAALASLDPQRGSRALVAVVLLFALRTWVRNDDWRDDYTLFTATALTSPNSARAQSNAGAVLAQRGELDVALAHYTAATHIAPRFVPAFLGRGKILEMTGHPADALAAYESARHVEPTNVEVGLRAGDLHLALGDAEEGEQAYLGALWKEPHHPELLAALARARALQGDLEGADVLRKQIDPRLYAFGTVPTRLEQLAAAFAR
jgi:tetratricopeptide (TPR) repeat protein